MFNTHEMESRQEEYINQRMRLAEHDDLARMARLQQATFAQRILNFGRKLWQCSLQVSRQARIHPDRSNRVIETVLH